MSKKDIRIQLNVTEDMNKKIEEMAKVMSLTKQDFIRYTLASAINSQVVLSDVLKELAQKELEKKEN